jgi:Holliday junction DNA helicase RuvA
MIGRLVGKIVEKGSDGALVDVHGIGYQIELPLSTLAGMPPVGESVTLSIHTHVREDDIRLFGFNGTPDRTAFRTMLRVSGVGPKLALAVLGGLSGNQLAEVIQNTDVKRLCAIPGIGKKTAERMILELGGKLKIEKDGKVNPAEGVFDELASALRNLGFKSTRVEQVLSDIRSDDAEEQPFEALLRQALVLLQGK